MSDILDNLPTFEMPEIYWNNTELMLNVEESKIAEAGKGIFTYEDIEKGQFIGFYNGRLEKSNGKCVGDYSFSLNRVWYLDARFYPRAYMAMINDSHGSKFKDNCEFVTLSNDEDGKKLVPKDRKIFLQALRNIKAGEELYASYGADYWSSERN
jgi:uncharacterized protein